ncbi:hypothetical protein THAOC_14894 [Thalassiosira oceanica]|uniref:Uncharacterized protein n=1 Tax=Thalassiosira oceanica TaxID=159749 RepID=K0STM1_THAOC|nr:hypothetical protein THAOC_14894 [Thalassiosira oceanica]|eukprot:EJK64376.1 hypothetical protein THAOC_14894 [Thalassiosira oceanica]
MNVQDPIATVDSERITSVACNNRRTGTNDEEGGRVAETHSADAKVVHDEVFDALGRRREQQLGHPIGGGGGPVRPWSLAGQDLPMHFRFSITGGSALPDGSVWTGRSDKHKLHVLRHMCGASVFIATKQWCKDKVRFCPYKRECLDTALYWLELPDKGSPNHLSDVENMRSISIARRSQKFLVEIT